MALSTLKKSIGHHSPVRLGWHYAKAFVAAFLNGFPARKLTVIGITGTDGKTTTVGMVAHILEHSGIPSGALSTAFFRIRGDITWNATQKTSPSPFVIQRFLRTLVQKGCTHAVLEYSSHGLVQGRTHWTFPSIAAITNTTPEHLDYHLTMEQYRADKGLLFKMLYGKGTKVLNRHDTTYELYSPIPSSRTIVYASEEKQMSDAEETLWLSDTHVSLTGVKAILHRNTEKHTWDIGLPVTGVFNLENALCAIGCAVASGVTLEQSLLALRTFTGVPGRMERIDEGQPFSVFVDFTVTPASYMRTLSTIKSMLTGHHRLLVLTGSCGDRMKEKRPIVGKICSEIADVVVVSNEDPYTEDPEKIIDEVWAGVDQKNTEAHRISDRRKAIEFLFAHAKPGDAVVLCGKGSDTMMWLKDGQVEWNEREIAREILRQR